MDVTIKRCDRCYGEYTSGSWSTWGITDTNGQKLDLCRTCSEQLAEWFKTAYPERFLDWGRPVHLFSTEPPTRKSRNPVHDAAVESAQASSIP